MQNRFSNSLLLKGLLEDIDIYKISKPKYKFRDSGVHFEEKMVELMISIKEHGILIPIMVRTSESGFEIVSGCRRYEACKRLGMRKLSCPIVEMDEKTAFKISLVENV